MAFFQTLDIASPYQPILEVYIIIKEMFKSTLGLYDKLILYSHPFLSCSLALYPKQVGFREL